MSKEIIVVYTVIGALCLFALLLGAVLFCRSQRNAERENDRVVSEMAKLAEDRRLARTNKPKTAPKGPPAAPAKRVEVTVHQGRVDQFSSPRGASSLPGSPTPSSHYDPLHPLNPLNPISPFHVDPEPVRRDCGGYDGGGTSAVSEPSSCPSPSYD